MLLTIKYNYCVLKIMRAVDGNKLATGPTSPQIFNKFINISVVVKMTTFSPLRPSPPHSDHLLPSQTTSSPLRPSPPLSDRLLPSQTTSSPLRPSPPLSDPLLPSQTTSPLRPPPPLSDRLIPSQTLSSPLRPPLPLSGPLLPSQTTSSPFRLLTSILRPLTFAESSSACAVTLSE